MLQVGYWKDLLAMLLHMCVGPADPPVAPQQKARSRKRGREASRSRLAVMHKFSYHYCCAPLANSCFIEQSRIGLLTHLVCGVCIQHTYSCTKCASFPHLLLLVSVHAR